jgi:hypothetical protein
VRWENRRSTAAWLALGGLVIAAPFAAVLAGARPPELALLASPRHARLFREVTGFAALGAVLLTLAFSLRLRSRGGSPPRRPRRGLHMVAGLAPLGFILLHTGGRWGHNLNGWLETCLLGGILTALAGKLGDSWLLHRLAVAGGRFRAGSRLWRLLWPRLHVLLVVALLALLAFHILLAFYFGGGL